MSRFEYDLREFQLTEKWNAKKQAEKFGDLVNELNRHGQQGWELIGVHSFDLVGGITGANKGKVNFTVWKRDLND